MKKLLNFIYKKLIKPKSTNEDIIRREFILNILLNGTILLSVIANISMIINYIKLGSGYIGIPPHLHFLIILFLFFLLYLSRQGFIFTSAALLTITYLLPNTLMLLEWGVDFPQGLVLYTLVLIMSSVLINTHFALLITVLITICLTIIGYLQFQNIIPTGIYWRDQILLSSDIVIIIIIFFIINLVSWLSNREIEKSLKRARQSEATLKKERDMLEITVEKRTKELKQAQIEKMSQLCHFAEFGRLSSGMFHDLVNPLTAISLNLEQIKDNNKLKETKSNLERAFTATKRMESFIMAVRKQMTRQTNKAKFSLTEETKQVIQILNHKATKNNIIINFDSTEDIKTYGDMIKFSQLITNLIANAIDSYEGLDSKNQRREVKIILSIKDKIIYLTIQDWGCGISQSNLNKIFEPFFTTKNFNKGTGIGLSSAKNIIEKDFDGKIKIETKENYGTKFIIKLPIKNN